MLHWFAIEQVTQKGLLCIPTSELLAILAPKFESHDSSVSYAKSSPCAPFQTRMRHFSPVCFVSFPCYYCPEITVPRYVSLDISVPQNFSPVRHICFPYANFLPLATFHSLTLSIPEITALHYVSPVITDSCYLGPEFSLQVACSKS